MLTWMVTATETIPTIQLMETGAGSLKDIRGETDKAVLTLTQMALQTHGIRIIPTAHNTLGQRKTVQIGGLTMALSGRTPTEMDLGTIPLLVQLYQTSFQRFPQLPTTQMEMDIRIIGQRWTMG